MNERIKELAKQAGMLYTLDSKPTHIDENGTHTFQEINVYKNFDPEKFAELIVQECAGIYDKIDNGNQHHGTDNYLEALQKHFGVEE